VRTCNPLVASRLFLRWIRKSLLVNRDDAVAGIEFAHAGEAKVGQIGLAVAISACEGRKLGPMVLAVKS
jgi:hypothetical protein